MSRARLIAARTIWLVAGAAAITLAALMFTADPFRREVGSRTVSI